MPRIRRWFHVSHDINSDPEVWELTVKFGDRGLRAWLELLSIADRNEGLIPSTQEQLVKAFSIKLNTVQTKTTRLLCWFEDKTWLVRDPLLRVRNYATYNYSGEGKKKAEPSPPNPPNLPNHLKKNHKNDSPPRREKLTLVVTWPDESLWLKGFLETEARNLVPTPNGTLIDLPWWNSVSETCGGLSLPFLTAEFNRMSAWLTENPSRSPASRRGWKRFIRTWLERAHEMERKKTYAHQKPSSFQRRR